MNILCINLESRKDRLAHMEIQLHGLKHEIVNAVETNECPSSFKNNQEYGCYLSHLKCLYKQRELNGNTLIIEDDIVFADNITEKIQLFLSEIPNNWCIAYLGTYDMKSERNITPISDTIVKVRSQWGGFAYMVNMNHLDYVIDMVEYYKCAVDRVYMMIQHSKPCYQANPMIAYTIDSYSDIRGKYYSYNTQEILSKKF